MGKSHVLSAPLPLIETHRTLRRSPYDNNLLNTCSYIAHSLPFPPTSLSSLCSISPTPSMSTRSNLCTSLSHVIFHMHKINATATAIATKSLCHPHAPLSLNLSNSDVNSFVESVSGISASKASRTVRARGTKKGFSFSSRPRRRSEEG